MGYAITQEDNDVTSYLKGFVCDNRSDIRTLPTKIPAGSSCICLEDSSVWMLGVDKEWKELG